MAKRDVIHKTGSTQRITTPPQEYRAMAIEDLHNKFRDDRSSGSRDIHTDTLITILCSPTGAE